MALADKLRKAASLFVVMDDPEPDSRPAPSASPASFPTPGAAAAPAAGGSDADSDLDARLARMNATIRNLNAGVADTAAGGAPPPPVATPSLPKAVPPATATPVTTAASAAASGAKTIDELLRETDGPDLKQIQAAAHDLSSAMTAEGGLDFATIYETAKLPVTPFTAEQTVDMLAELPADLPLEVKRRTVNVTIAALGKSMGATAESIVADASRKLAALAAYEAGFTKQTDEFVAAADFEINGLLQQVEEKRKAILDARQRQSEVTQKIEAEGDRLDDILEFFSLDIGASRYAGTPAASGAAPPPLPNTPPPLP